MVTHRREDKDRDDESPLAEDQDEWSRATQDVTPLKDRRDAAPVDEDQPSTGLAERLRARREPPVTAGEEPAFAVDRRTSERLRRGQIPVEATLDLHGFTQDEALAAIDAFLLQSWNEGRRCVLLITGKGTARDGGGVLRSAVPRWLTEGAHRDRITAVAPAQPHHGGDGALYVLLRRRRAVN